MAKLTATVMIQNIKSINNFLTTNEAEKVKTEKTGSSTNVNSVEKLPSTVFKSSHHLVKIWTASVLQ